MYPEQKKKFTEDELFDMDYVLFSKYVEWNTEQEKRDYKRQIKGYKDNKVIKQMFNAILDLIDTCSENDRIIGIRDRKIKSLEARIKELETND